MPTLVRGKWGSGTRAPGPTSTPMRTGTRPSRRPLRRQSVGRPLRTRKSPGTFPARNDGSSNWWGTERIALVRQWERATGIELRQRGGPLDDCPFGRSRSERGESAVWNAGGDVSLGDGVGSSEPGVATSLVSQDDDRSQSSVGCDQVSWKLSVVHQANDVGPGDSENVRGVLGRQFGVVGKQVHRCARSEINQQVTSGRSRCWRQLDIALIGSHR